MKYYPIFLNIKDRPCVVIGGGKVAERKVVSLLEAGARVKTISPDITPTLKSFAQESKTTYYSRPYQSGDLKGSFLAYSATGDMEINKKITEEARAEGVMLNVVDMPDRCDFIMPSLVRREDLLIAISTCGKSPALAKSIRKELEERYGWEYGVFLDLLGAIRVRLLTKDHDSSYNKTLFLKLVSSPLLRLIKEGKVDDIEKILVEVLGNGFTLSNLKASITPNNRQD